jgi:hypothetical protein
MVAAIDEQDRKVSDLGELAREDGAGEPRTDDQDSVLRACRRHVKVWAGVKGGSKRDYGIFPDLRHQGRMLRPGK